MNSTRTHFFGARMCAIHFSFLSQNDYNLWHAVKTSKTWGELRARVSKKFYQDEVECRMESLEEFACENIHELEGKAQEDSNPFDPKDLHFLGEVDQYSWGLVFPPIIEQIVNNGSSSWQHWLQEQRIESVCGGMGFPEYVPRMKDKY